MAACFVAGAAGDWDDEELDRGVLGAGKSNACAVIYSAPSIVVPYFTLWIS